MEIAPSHITEQTMVSTGSTEDDHPYITENFWLDVKNQIKQITD